MLAFQLCGFARAGGTLRFQGSIFCDVDVKLHVPEIVLQWDSKLEGEQQRMVQQLKGDDGNTGDGGDRAN